VAERRRRPRWVQDPRGERQRALVVALVLTLVVAAGSAAVAVTTIGETSRAAGTASVSAVVAAPLARSLWLGVRWLRKGDRRFALVAAAVLLIVAAGGAVAMVTG
jgi:hypothetical protein